MAWTAKSKGFVWVITDENGNYVMETARSKGSKESLKKNLGVEINFEGYEFGEERGRFD